MLPRTIRSLLVSQQNNTTAITNALLSQASKTTTLTTTSAAPPAAPAPKAVQPVQQQPIMQGSPELNEEHRTAFLFFGDNCVVGLNQSAPRVGIETPPCAESVAYNQFYP